MHPHNNINLWLPWFSTAALDIRQHHLAPVQQLRENKARLLLEKREHQATFATEIAFIESELIHAEALEAVEQYKQKLNSATIAQLVAMGNSQKSCGLHWEENLLEMFLLYKMKIEEKERTISEKDKEDFKKTLEAFAGIERGIKQHKLLFDRLSHPLLQIDEAMIEVEAQMPRLQSFLLTENRAVYLKEFRLQLKEIRSILACVQLAREKISEMPATSDRELNEAFNESRNEVLKKIKCLETKAKALIAIRQAEMEALIYLKRAQQYCEDFEKADTLRALALEEAWEAITKDFNKKGNIDIISLEKEWAASETDLPKEWASRALGKSPLNVPLETAWIWAEKITLSNPPKQEAKKADSDTKILLQKHKKLLQQVIEHAQRDVAQRITAYAEQKKTKQDQAEPGQQKPIFAARNGSPILPLAALTSTKRPTELLLTNPDIADLRAAYDYKCTPRP